jgi:hypothetical protein
VTRSVGTLIAVMLAATAAFAVGVAIERHQRTSETARAGSAHSESPAAHAAETGGEAAVTEGSPAGAGGNAAGHSDSSETLLGVNPESMGLVIVAVALSLLLALAVWRAAGVWWVLGAVALAMGVFCALDVREVIHQAHESRTALVLLAAGVAALHLVAALLAGSAARAVGRSSPPSHAT